MPISSDKGWVLPVLPEACGPAELAKTALDYRSRRIAQGGKISKLSNSAVERLISLAYSASHLQEEGRYVRCTFYSPGTDDLPRIQTETVWFETIVPLPDPSAVRKLAPACNLEGSAIVVREMNDQLAAIGIVTRRRGLDLVPPGVPFFAVEGVKDGLSLIIHAPGHLTVEEGFGLELRGGRIRSSDMLSLQLPPLADVFGEITKGLFGSRLESIPNLPLNVAPKFAIDFWMAELWERILNRTRRTEHGGAFLIAEPSAIDHIDIRYGIADLNLGQKIVEFWDSCFSAKKGGGMAVDAFTRWRDCWSSLSAGIDLVAQLSSVDGCVVLDPKLRVLGFGGKLLSDSASAPPGTQRSPVHWFNRRPDPELPDRVKQFGTRHGSAYTFCRNHPWATAFVVSQDGDVRVFLSNATQVSMMDASRIQEFPALARQNNSTGLAEHGTDEIH